MYRLFWIAIFVLIPLQASAHGVGFPIIAEIDCNLVVIKSNKPRSITLDTSGKVLEFTIQ